MILTAISSIRSRFTPLPLGMHLAFCLIATAVFAAIYLRKKDISHLIWALLCDSTLILQFYNDRITASAVGICEIAMLLILAWLWVGRKKAEKLKAAQKEALCDDENPEQTEEPTRDDTI